MFIFIDWHFATTSMLHLFSFLFFLLLLFPDFDAPQLFQSPTSLSLKAAADNLISLACFDEYWELLCKHSQRFMSLNNFRDTVGGVDSTEVE